MELGLTTGRTVKNLLQSKQRQDSYSKESESMRVSGTQAPEQNDDAALIARLRAGDQTAMAGLYDRYSGVVYGVALRVLANTTAAEDVVQEVFLQLWRNPQAFDADRGRIAPWLAVITRNRAIDLLRKRPPEDDIAELPLSNGLNLEDESAQKLTAEKVRGVLKDLPQEQRKVLEMAFFEGMTHTEIAGKTGDPLGTVKTRIRAGLLTLRKAFA
ncbi:MAG TPA: sigma-70 family RNA polymerase sigma factor [Candidatus Angelobacter sp.]|nr:sigma-70 family RNA polymerase sigma factor [Candidatus Angelobacter sp.]